MADWHEITGRIRDDPLFRRQVARHPDRVPELRPYSDDFRRSLARYALSVMAHYHERIDDDQAGA